MADISRPVAAPESVPVVLDDTGIQAGTTEVNGRVGRWLDPSPVGAAIFPKLAIWWNRPCAIREHDLAALYRLIDHYQALLEHIGVSGPEVERLNHAARGGRPSLDYA